MLSLAINFLSQLLCLIFLKQLNLIVFKFCSLSVSQHIWMQQLLCHKFSILFQKIWISKKLLRETLVTPLSFEVAIFDAQIFSHSILLCKKGLCIENGAIFALFDISLAIKRWAILFISTQKGCFSLMAKFGRSHNFFFFFQILSNFMRFYRR